MDQSLDDIIASRPRGVRRTASRRSARQQVLGNPGPSPATRARAVNAPSPVANGKVNTPAAAVTTGSVTDKIVVSNLPHDVNEAQIKELFHSTVGPLREVTLHYDAAGKSKGVAAVQFQRKGDGTKAYQQYNNRLIDGKRPMKIEIIVDLARSTTTTSLVSRVAPAPAANAAAATSAATAAPAVARVGRAPGGRGRRGARGGRAKSDRPAKSAADLDAEMEDYTASNAPAAA